VFDAAAAFLGTSKESTWVFEDSFVALQTAKRAGYHTVGIYDRYNFNLDRMPEVCDEYIASGETLKRLIPQI
jgi:beta-phosphoglucomutase-like phosphatase (HAD superfamily)